MFIAPPEFSPGHRRGIELLIFPALSADFRALRRANQPAVPAVSSALDTRLACSLPKKVRPTSGVLAPAKPMWSRRLKKFF
jgi:hypothetical protein